MLVSVKLTTIHHLIFPVITIDIDVTMLTRLNAYDSLVYAALNVGSTALPVDSCNLIIWLKTASQPQIVQAIKCNS